MWMKDGQYSAELHHSSHLAVGVPGTVAGLHLAWKEQGRLPWKRLVDPAIALARDGFLVSEALARSLKSVQRTMQSIRRRWRRSRRTVFPTKRARRSSSRTSRARSTGSPHRDRPAFYEGEDGATAREGNARARRSDHAEDLKNYTAVHRAPLIGSYRGYEVIRDAAALSSGGVGLVREMA